MKRISLYLDKKLIKKVDAAKNKLGYSSRKEFFSAMGLYVVVGDLEDYLKMSFVGGRVLCAVSFFEHCECY